jgi:hypothetical protein
MDRRQLSVSEIMNGVRRMSMRTTVMSLNTNIRQLFLALRRARWLLAAVAIFLAMDAEWAVGSGQ